MGHADFTDCCRIDGHPFIYFSNSRCNAVMKQGCIVSHVKTSQHTRRWISLGENSYPHLLGFTGWVRGLSPNGGARAGGRCTTWGRNSEAATWANRCIITLPKLNSSPLKSYRNPIRKACLPTIIFQGLCMLNFGGVSLFWEGAWGVRLQLLALGFFDAEL